MTWTATIIPEYLLENDAAAGFNITQDFACFDQINDLFNSAIWDDSARSKDTDAFFASYKMQASPRCVLGIGLKSKMTVRFACRFARSIITTKGRFGIGWQRRVSAMLQGGGPNG